MAEVYKTHPRMESELDRITDVFHKAHVQVKFHSILLHLSRCTDQHNSRLVPADLHRNGFRHSCTDEVSYISAPQIVEDLSHNSNTLAV